MSVHHRLQEGTGRALNRVGGRLPKRGPETRACLACVFGRLNGIALHVNPLATRFGGLVVKKAVAFSQGRIALERVIVSKTATSFACMLLGPLPAQGLVRGPPKGANFVHFYF